MRLATRPTALGYKATVFAVVVAIAYVASPYHNLFFLTTTFMVVVALVTPLVNAWHGRELNGRLDPLPPVPAGAESTFRVRVATRGRTRLLVDARIAVAIPRGSRRSFAVGIAAAPVVADADVLAGAIPPLPRGVHAIAVDVGTTHPLGLLRTRRQIVAAADGRTVVVHPAPFDEACVAATDPTAAAAFRRLRDVAIGRREEDAQPVGMREHRDGEPLRDVHWKASARRGRLVVTEWERSRAEGCVVVLDRRCDGERFERALSAIVGIAFACGDVGRRVELRTQDATVRFGSDAAADAAFLSLLATLQPLPTDAAPPPAGDGIALPAALEVSR